MPLSSVLLACWFCLVRSFASCFFFSHLLVSFSSRTVYDASGYYAGSVMAGNNIRSGDPELCRSLNEEINNIQSYHALDDANRTGIAHEHVHGFMIPAAYLPFRVQLVNVRYETVIENSPFRTQVIHQTACMPKACNLNDLLQVMSYANVSHLRNNLIMRDTRLIDVRILHESYDFFTDSAFFYFMYALCFSSNQNSAHVCIV